MSRFRKAALMRNGGLCAVPGCSRAAVHVHHLVFRSRGGKDEPWNGVALCAVHHLHGIHMGYLEVTGRAGERLHWKFATGEAVPTEEWVTLGDDDVRRADAGGAGAGAAARNAGAGSRAPPRAGGVTDVESGAVAAARVTDVESGPTGAAPGVTDVERVLGGAAAGAAREAVTDAAAVTDVESPGAHFVAEPGFGGADDWRWIVACEEATLHAA
jgi:hypothetical protein